MFKKKSIIIIVILTLFLSNLSFLNPAYSYANSQSSIIAKEELREIKEIVKENEKSRTLLVNKKNPLKSGYKPNDLIVPSIKATKKIYVSKKIEKELTKMFEDSKKQGLDLSLVSGYRSSSYQSDLYKNSIRKNGKAYTEKYIAKPNQSEHQTGLAVDISTKSVGYDLITKFEKTKEGKWLAKNAYKYGFILRYTKDRTKDTGYGYEPWHFRYVGVDVAKFIYKNKLVLEDLYSGIKFNEILQVNSINPATTTIKGIGQSGTTVKAYIEKIEIGKSIIEHDGTYKIKIDKQKHDTKVTVKMSAYGYKTVSQEITVKNKNFKEELKVNGIKTTTTTITIKGKGHKDAKVKAYVGNKEIGNTVVDEDGTYKIKINKQKKNTKVIIKMSKLGYKTISKEIKVK